jgi:hypothetical protein
MGIKQRIKSLVNKKFDGELELRSYPKHGIYSDKKKEWGELYEEISTIVEFYMFIYGVEVAVDAVDYQNSIAFQFAGLHDMKFLKGLKYELVSLFRKKVVYATYAKSGAIIRIFFDTDKISFVK